MISDQGRIGFGLREGNFFWAFVDIPQVDGSHPYKAVVTNAEGRQTEATVYFIRDTVPPKVTIDSPTDGFITSNPEITIMGTVDDLEALVRLGWYGPEIPLVDGVFTGTVTLQEGSNNVAVTARDLAGNDVYVSRMVILDAKPPQINVTYPAEGLTVNTSTLIVTGSIIDENLKEVKVSVNGSQPQALALTGANFSGVVNLGPGQNTLVFDAVDKAGNSTNVTRSVLLDVGVPAVIITTPLSKVLVSGVINVTVEASDTASGITSVTLFVDGQARSTQNQAPYNFTLDTSALTSGLHTITARAMDGAGNQVETSVDVTVDNTSPTVDIVAPASGTAVSGLITVSVEAGDSISGVVSITLYVDNQPLFTLKEPPYSFSVDTSGIASGSHTLTARAIDRGGNQGETSIPIMVVEDVRIEITLPANGATINKSSAIVQGKIYNQTGEVGVVANGVLAEVQGGDFAVIVPLQIGQNMVTVTATRPNGLKGQASITISTETQEEMVGLTASPTSGILDQTGILNVTFETQADIVNPVSSYSWDFNGDGIPEITGNQVTVIAQYQHPGVYLPKVTVTDSENNTYEETTIVYVLSREEMDALLRSKWDGMKEALSHGNINEALNYFVKDSREEYREIFELLAPQLPALVSAMREINVVDIKGNSAEYYIKRFQKGVDISYFIYFMRDENGIWRISSF
jgi:hypothetical protein